VGRGGERAYAYFLYDKLKSPTDRYGEPPASVHALILVSRLRRLAVKAGLPEVVVTGGNLRVSPAALPDKIEARL